MRNIFLLISDSDEIFINLFHAWEKNLNRLQVQGPNEWIDNCNEWIDNCNGLSYSQK